VNKEIKVALPKGRLLAQTAARLKKAGWGLGGYQEKTRLYRITSQSLPNLSAKVFHERDIPIQVAIGNYDLGICGSDWIEELLTRYPSSGLLKVGNLGYGDGALYAAGSPKGIASVEEVKAKTGIIRIASEYPNLAESFALRLRLRRFGIFPLWGAAEAYPPESADLALVCGTVKELAGYGLVALSRVLTVSACLIANKASWEGKDMAKVVASIYDKALAQEEAEAEIIRQPRKPKAYVKTSDDTVRLALPDGHQQEHTLRLLAKAGIPVKDYPSLRGNRRPTTSMKGVAIKVIRPQDMPLQVANGNFDLAISGRDWLREHLEQFPSSPVKELVDLRLGGVKIVAVVSQNLSISDVSGLRELNAKQSVPLRVASEYVNIADRYARDNHLGLYRIIPTWGASEAFLPEDADLLIENTQTGRTIARHNLKIIDTIFESSACLIGNSKRVPSPARQKRINSIIKALEKAAKEL
jgi:ATP phosphoribosyltransferase